MEPKLQVEEEELSESNDEEEPGVLLPEVLEYAQVRSLQRRYLGNGTNIREEHEWTHGTCK